MKVQTEKYCRRCNQVRPAHAFGRRADKSKGLRAWCLECESPAAQKYCKRCQERKPLDQFHFRRESTGEASHKGWCKDCQSKYLRAWRFKKHYGITVEDYDRMFKAQGGRCKICKQERELKVDHCHEKGHVRGLLCDLCNRGIGFFKDDPVWLSAAANYLRKDRQS